MVYACLFQDEKISMAGQDMKMDTSGGNVNGDSAVNQNGEGKNHDNLDTNLYSRQMLVTVFS